MLVGVSKFARRIPLVFAGLAIGLALLWLVHAPLLRSLGAWLDVGETPRPVRYVVILAGDEFTRPFAGAALLRTGFAREALLINAKAGPEESDGLRRSTATIAKAVLLARDVPPSAIVELEGRSNSTFGDAGLVAEYLRRHSEGDVAILTSHYHTRRSRWVFRRVLGAQFDRVHFVSCPTDGFELDDWWRSKTGVASVGSEYMKWAIYMFLYGEGLAYAAGAVGLGIVAAWVWRRRTRRADAPAHPSHAP